MLTVTATVVALMLGHEARWAHVWLRADPSMVAPVTTPTRDYFGVGAGGFVSALAQVGPYFDVGGEAGYLFASRAEGSPLPGPASLVVVGPVVRVHSPRLAPGFVFWAQTSLDYVRTGTLDRVSFGVGLGGSYLLAGGTIALGPRLDFREILGMTAEAFPTHDAGLLSFGLSVELALFDPTDGAARPLRAQRGGAGTDPDPDRDGVLGAADQCPSEAEDRDAFQDGDGCPELDNDGDGLNDVLDRCPEERGLASGRGCPDQDADETPDRLDQCPAVPGPSDGSGCPHEPQVVVTEHRIAPVQEIAFALGAATVLPRSFPLLDGVARATRARTPLCLRIEGYADADVPKLAQDRADAVRAYLVSKGVPRLSLSATGAPFAPGRDRNHRVEFLRVPCGNANGGAP